MKLIFLKIGGLLILILLACVASLLSMANGPIYAIDIGFNLLYGWVLLGALVLLCAATYWLMMRNQGRRWVACFALLLVCLAVFLFPAWSFFSNGQIDQVTWAAPFATHGEPDEKTGLRQPWGALGAEVTARKQQLLAGKQKKFEVDILNPDTLSKALWAVKRISRNNAEFVAYRTRLHAAYLNQPMEPIDYRELLSLFIPSLNEWTEAPMSFKVDSDYNIAADMLRAQVERHEYAIIYAKVTDEACDSKKQLCDERGLANSIAVKSVLREILKLEKEAASGSGVDTNNRAGVYEKGVGLLAHLEPIEAKGRLDSFIEKTDKPAVELMLLDAQARSIGKVGEGPNIKSLIDQQEVLTTDISQTEKVKKLWFFFVTARLFYDLYGGT